MNKESYKLLEMSDQDEVKFHVARDPHSFHKTLVIACQDVGDPRYRNPNVRYFGEIIMRRYEKGVMLGAPAMHLHTRQSQQLMDELWSAGVRPTEGHGSTGQIGATVKHLDDMRTIVNKIMEVDLK
jgi:hypothetical protein